MAFPIRFGFIRNFGVAALPGYFIADTPWAGTKTNTNWAARGQDSGRLAGGSLNSSGAQNDEYTHDHQFQAGTYKHALIHRTDTDRGITSIQQDAVEKGTVDGYSSPAAGNVYAEVTGIAVTVGLKVVTYKMATKNASSTNFYGVPQTTAWVRTGA